MSTVLDGGLTKSEFWALAHLPGEAELLAALTLQERFVLPLHSFVSQPDRLGASLDESEPLVEEARFTKPIQAKE